MPASAEALLRENAWLRRLVARLVGPGADADDVVQDVGVLALTSAPHELRSVRAWLTAVAQRVVRRRQRRDARAAASVVHAARGEAQPSAFEVVARVEAHRRVVEAVLALDEPYRTVVLLRYFEEHTPAAIAHALGCPIATVRTRLARGLALLRGRLEASLGPRNEWARALGFVVPGPLVPLAGTAGGTMGGLIGMGTKKAGAGAAIALAVSLSTLLWWSSMQADPPDASVHTTPTALHTGTPPADLAETHEPVERPSSATRTVVPPAEEECVPDEGPLPAPSAGEVVVLVLSERGQRVVGARVLREVSDGAESGEPQLTLASQAATERLREALLKNLPPVRLTLGNQAGERARAVPARTFQLQLSMSGATGAQNATTRLTAGEGSELKIGDSILRATDFLTSTTRLSASRYTRFEEVGRTGPDGTCRLPSTGDLTLLATTPRSTSGLVHFTAPAEGARVVLVVRRTATVRGVVVDAAGQPLADATVEAAPPAGAFPQPRRTTTTTGRDGRFALDLDAFGPHDLTARAGDIGSETLRIEASPGTGEDVRIRMLGAVALHGDVRDPRGAPSTDATVYVVRLGADPHADPRAQRFEGTANASGDGSFRILLPAAGEYLVTAQHAQWAHAEAVRVRIDAGRPPEPVRLVLGERAAMAGTVRWIDGFPAAGARVVVRPIAPALPRGVNPGPFVGPTGFADVREDGTYRIEGLQPHVRYRVLCMPDPGRPYVRIERTDVAPSLQDFVLDRALFGDAEVRLMLRSGGQAIGTAHAIVSRRGRDGTWQRGQPTQITFDAGGQAIIGGLERGATYAIELRCEALGRCRTAPFVAGATTDQIVQPVAPGRVEVTVLDSAGRPVLGAKVVLREDAPAGLRPQDSIRTTDVAGRAVWDSVSVLSWTVFAERGEERSEPVAVKVASHKTSRVEITLH